MFSAKKIQVSVKPLVPAQQPGKTRHTINEIGLVFILDEPFHIMD